MKYLIVIPARGGSKGIPKKNIYPLNGKPLIMYTLELMMDFDFEGDLVVSTDSAEIKEVVQKCDWVKTIDRPADISGDSASTETALIHALEVMEQKDAHYDAVVTLQATSPFRTKQMITRCFLEYERNIDEYDALLTLSETRTDYWVKKKDDTFDRLYPDAPRRRQDRKPIYYENSAIYITKRESLIETHSVLGKNANAIVINGNEVLDINEPVDLIIAECILQEKKYETN